MSLGVAKGGQMVPASDAGINFLQINLHHCADANDALANYVISNNINVVACQDPYIVDGVAPGVPPDWPAFYSFNTNAAIFITNLDYAIIRNLVLENSVTVSLNVFNNVIYVCSQYSSPSGNIDKDFVDLGNHFPHFEDVIIAGDFNVPLLQFGYTRQSDRSEILLEHLSEKNLSIVNDPDAVFSFVQGALKGRPDLTLAGLNICEKIINWSVDSDTFSFSDHRYIKFSLDYVPEKRYNIRYKTKNKSFSRFNKIMKTMEKDLLEDLHVIQNTDDLDHHINSLMEKLTEVSTTCFRKGTISHKPTIRWFSDNLRIQRNKVAASYKRHRRNLEDDSLKEIYKKYRNEYKKSVKMAKRENWLTYCEKTNDAFGKLHEYISGKNLKHNDLIFTRLDGSTSFDSYNEVAAMLMNEHFAVDNIPDNIFEYNSDTVYQGTDSPDPVTSRELKYALNRQNNGKAPGYDMLDALIIKNFCNSCHTYVKRMFTACLRHGHFPKPWKRGLVIFFRKRNKDGKTARSYRPITLLCIIGKILERIIKIRIVPNLESKNYWDEAQHGFREEHSTVTAMRTLKDIINRRLYEFKYVSLASIDIQAAFDAVVWEILARIIDDLPIQNYLKSILKNYISNRKIGFSFTNGIRWFNIFRGCPQGSCIGPLLWLIIADYLIKRYKIKFEDLLSYADDFVVIAYGDTRKELETDMNSKIAWFSELCQELELTISKEKCLSMMFGRYTLENRHPIFKIGTTSIPVKDTILYLGFHLDSRFNWITHLENIREKIKNYTSSIKKTTRRDRGLNTMYRKIWYTHIIEKQITYGSEIWYNDLKSHALLKLSSCQRIGLMSIVSTYRSVSTDALCVLTGIIPLHIHLKYESLKYQVINEDEQIMIDGDVIGRTNIMNNLSTKNFPYYNDVKNLHFTVDKDSDYLNKSIPIIYTDGSKMIHGVGAAFTVYYDGIFIQDFKVTLHSKNSIFQAELLAIRYAINWFINSRFHDAVIFTDSRASFMVLQRTFPVNNIVKEIFDMLIQNARKRITVGWTRAHIGNIGNERADELAKSAINENESDLVDIQNFPISLIKKFCREKAILDWQSYWEQSGKGRDTYSVMKRVNTNYICVNQIVQYFITSHGSFPVFLNKIGKRGTPNCDCGKRGNITHYLFGRCPLVHYFFYFDNSASISTNIKRVLFNQDNYRKLCHIYNSLNEHYSFIKYKF